MTALDRVISALETAGCGPRRSGDGYSARCPSHDDANPSLSVSNGDGKVLLHCHAGCALDDVRDALDLTAADLFDNPKPTDGKASIVREYNYTDEAGKLVFQVVRMSPKSFRQRRPDGAGGWVWKLDSVTRCLYNLPEVIEAARAGRHAFIAEGEKDAETLRSRGLVGTCNPAGAGKWRDSYNAALNGARVVILPDADEVGRSHAQAMADSLSESGKVASVVVVELSGLPEHGDVTDWLAAGHDIGELKALVREAEAVVGDEPDEPLTGRPPVDLAALGITPVDWQALWASDPAGEEWVVEPILPRGRAAGIFAPGGTGKSLLAADIAAAKATGRSIFGQPVQPPASVVYLDLEMTEEDLRERLIDLGYCPADDLSNLHYYQLPMLPPLDSLEGGDVLMAIVKLHEPELVIIDTMARVVEGDENSADTYRSFYRCSGCRLKAAGVGLIRLDHQGKDPTKGQRGSSSKGDDLDLVWRLSQSEENIILHRVKSRVSYVPAQVTLTREADPVLRHVLAPAVWPSGTREVADLLDRLAVALDASSAVASATLTRNGTGKRKAVVLAALSARRLGQCGRRHCTDFAEGLWFVGKTRA